MELVGAGGETLRLSVVDGDARWHLAAESNLGEEETVLGRRCRSLQTWGSIYHKTEWMVQLPAGFHVQALRLQSHYRGDDLVDVRVMLTDRTVLVRGEIAASHGWQDLEFQATETEHEDVDVLKQVDYGTGAIRVTAIEFLDRHDRSVAQVTYGQPLTVRVHCVAVAPVPDQAVTLCVGFARQGFTHQAYIYRSHLTVPESGAFVIENRLQEVRLGSGLWYINVGIGAADIFKQSELQYFSMDPSWYHLLSGRLEFRVLSLTKFDANGCFYEIPAEVEVQSSVPASEVDSVHVPDRNRHRERPPA
jgi:hypothetical protein